MDRDASIEDIAACRFKIVRFHELGVLHPDVNRYNFIVQDSGEAYLVGDATAVQCKSRDEFQKELWGLKQQLTTEEMDGDMVYLDPQINQARYHYETGQKHQQQAAEASYCWQDQHDKRG